MDSNSKKDGLSIAAKPWVPPTPSTVSAPAKSASTLLSGSTPVVVGAFPTPIKPGVMPTFPSVTVGGGLIDPVLQQMALMAMGGGSASLASPVSVQVGVSAPFIPTISSTMATRASVRVPRGRGNSGRGLRAQQEIKQKAAVMPPPYFEVVGVAEEGVEEEDTYNPLAPKPAVPKPEEDPTVFHTRAALDVLGDDVGGVPPSVTTVVTARTTPKAPKNVIGSNSGTPAMPICKPTPQYTPAPTNSPFHFTVSANKPLGPLTPSGGASQGDGITPGSDEAPENGSAAASDDDDVLPAGCRKEAEALRVDADTFFTEQADESQVKQAAKVFKRNEENPYSITSLQGVRATMPTVEPAAWFPIRCGDEDVFVPAPFKPDNVQTPTDGPIHASICHPAQYPRARLSLFNYLCYTCPIACQLSKITDRPPDLKLGGICGDIHPACIAHLVEVLSGIRLQALDVFGHNFGRCNLWLLDPNDAPRMMASLDRRVWMSPVPHGYAVVVDDDESREYLLWYLEGLREHGPRRVRFPRHLMTCEKWIV